MLLTSEPILQPLLDAPKNTTVKRKSTSQNSVTFMGLSFILIFFYLVLNFLINFFVNKDMDFMVSFLCIYIIMPSYHALCRH